MSSKEFLGNIRKSVLLAYENTTQVVAGASVDTKMDIDASTITNSGNHTWSSSTFTNTSGITKTYHVKFSMQLSFAGGSSYVEMWFAKNLPGNTSIGTVRVNTSAVNAHILQTETGRVPHEIHGLVTLDHTDYIEFGASQQGISGSVTYGSTSAYAAKKVHIHEV